MNSSVTVVAISGAHVTGGSTTTIPSPLVAVDAGVGISSTVRAPRSIVANPAKAPVEIAVESPQKYRQLRSRLRSGASLPRLPAGRGTSSLPSTVGSHNAFWVNTAAIGTNGSSQVQRAATLRQSTSHGYIWVDDSLAGKVSDSQVQLIGRDFENGYTSDTTHFGPSTYTTSAAGYNHRYEACDSSGTPTGGSVPAIIPPGDNKGVVFVVDITGLGKGVGGYFSSVNYTPQLAWNCLIGTPPYTAANVPQSNEAPMIYVGFDSTASPQFETDEDLVRGTSHEFQHLINFVNKIILQDGG